MKRWYKLCPICWNEIKKDAIKCQYCKERIDSIKKIECPFCANEIYSNSSVCEFCGEKIIKNVNKINKRSEIDLIDNLYLDLVNSCSEYNVENCKRIIDDIKHNILVLIRENTYNSQTTKLIELKDRIAIKLWQFSIDLWNNKKDFINASFFIQEAEDMAYSEELRDELHNKNKIIMVKKAHQLYWYDNNLCWYCKNNKAEKNSFKIIQIKKERWYDDYIVSDLSPKRKSTLEIPCCKHCSKKIRTKRILMFLFVYVLFPNILIFLNVDSVGLIRALLILPWCIPYYLLDDFIFFRLPIRKHPVRNFLKEKWWKLRTIS